MKVLRGTFRLSLVVLVTALVWAAVVAVDEARDMAAADQRMWVTLRCAERFLDKDMSGFTNVYGNIDIGKAGCASGPFLATFDEVREALKQADPFTKRYSDVFNAEIRENFVTATIWFVATNLAALLGLLVWRVGRWVWNGYRDGHESNSIG